MQLALTFYARSAHLIPLKFYLLVYTGTQLFLANHLHGLKALVGEASDSQIGAASYYGVALTKADKCKTLDGAENGGEITGFDRSMSVSVTIASFFVSCTCLVPAMTIIAFPDVCTHWLVPLHIYGWPI